MGYTVTFEHITKRFPGCTALSDVSFEIAEGEIHALVGENGAGKSTLLNILHGVTKPDEGFVCLNGERIDFNDAKDAIRYGVTKVHQEINLIPDLTVQENLMLGTEETKAFLLDNKTMRNKALKLLEQVKLSIDPDIKVRNLSTGQLQLLQIAKAISINAKMISFDEPTASLSKKETDILFDIISDLKNNGVTILYVSHRMDEIFRICDRCTVLRDGRWIDTAAIKDVDKSALIRMMVGRDVSAYARRLKPRKAEYDKKVLEVKKLAREGIFKDISFCLYKGEILGFYGLVGSGRTEVMRAIFGADRLDQGEIFINEEKVKIKNTKSAIKLKIGLISENRKSEGFIYEFSNADNIALTALDKFKSLGFMNKKKKLRNCEAIGEIVDLKPRDPTFKTINLSGGNQQKVVLAKWLSADMDILIFDEPTKGIDVGAKAEIYKLMEELVEQGKSLIIISSEQPEVLGMSDRLLIMREGKIVMELMPEKYDEKLIMTYALEGEGLQ